VIIHTLNSGQTNLRPFNSTSSLTDVRSYWHTSHQGQFNSRWFSIGACNSVILPCSFALTAVGRAKGVSGKNSQELFIKGNANDDSFLVDLSQDHRSISQSLAFILDGTSTAIILSRTTFFFRCFMVSNFGLV